MAGTRIGQDTRAGLHRTSSAQGLVEFALVLPVLLLLIMGIIEFGRALFTYAQASNGLRDALRYGAATGFDPTAPQHADCNTIEEMAEESVWFASSTQATATYHLASSPGISVDCPTFTSNPSAYPIQNGDRVTVQSAVTISFITPLLSNMFPPLTFTLEGTRTVAASITYGEGIPALATMDDVYVFCNDPDYLYIEWPSDTTGIVDWYQIFRGDSTDPIGEIDEADADQYDGVVGTLSGCTGLPGTLGSCHDFSSDFGSPVSHRYYVQACSTSLGCSPIREAVGGPLSCPAQTLTPAQPTIDVYGPACGFGEHFVQLDWSYPGDPLADQITEYRIYRGSPTGTLVKSLAAPVTSCTDCDPDWDGSGPLDYYVVAFNGLESAPSATVSIPACLEFSAFYFLDTTVADDGGAVPGLATESNAMNLTCGAGDVDYNMRKDENHYWFSRPFPAAYTLPGGTYTLYVDVTTVASKRIWYDITLSVCRVASAYTSCDAVAFIDDYLFPDAGAGGTLGEKTIALGSVGTPMAEIGDRMRLEFNYDTSEPYGAEIDIGVQGACGGNYDSRITFP